MRLLSDGDSWGFHNYQVNNGFVGESGNVGVSGNRRSNQVLLWIVGLSLILLIVSALVTSNREPKSFASNTPEGVVQLYLAAVIEGKHDKAASFFVSNSECDASDIDRAFISDTLRVNLVSSEISGDSAYVKIDANTNSGGIFEDGYVESHTYRLTKEMTGWRIQGIPWPLWDCGVVGK